MIDPVDVRAVVERPKGWHPVFAGLGIAELVIGLCALFAADYVPVFDVLAALGGIAGIAALSYCIVRPESVKVYDLFSATLLVAYGTGSLNSVVSLAIDHQQLIGVSATSQYWFTRTLSLVLCVCGVLHIVGRIDKNGYLLSETPSTKGDAYKIVALAIPFLLLYLALLATGKIGFMANVSADGGPEVSPLASLVLALAVPIGALALAAGLKIAWSKTSMLLLLLSGLLLLSQFAIGRRVFLFSLLTYILCSLFVRRPKKIVNLRNVVVLTTAVLLLYVATTAFYAMRMAAWSMGGNGSVTHVSILDLIPKAYDIYTQDRSGRLQTRAANNVKLRTFVLQYLTQISEGESPREPLYGDDLHRALIVATPSVMYPTKYQDRLFSAEEPLINPAFGIAVFDGPNSILTAGVADFGVFGMFLYPIVMCFVMSLVLRFVYKFAPPAVGLFFGMFACGILLTAETDIAGYFTSIRAIIPVTLLLCIYFGLHNKPRPRSALYIQPQPRIGT